MRVLVAGGAGFIGSHLCERLLSDGCEVIALDNLSSGSIENIAHLCANSGFRFCQADICMHQERYDNLDAVMNFASPASPQDYLLNPVQTMLTGSIGTKYLLDVAFMNRARFLMASTSEVYGDPMVNPQREDYCGNVDTLCERSVYDEAKRFSETLVMTYHRRYDLDVRIARLFNTYGPRMRESDGRVLSNFITQALAGRDITVYGDGSQTRSLCHISDTVEGIVRLLKYDHPGIHAPVNIGNPREMSVGDIADMVVRRLNSRSAVSYRPLHDGDPKVRRPDISRAKELLSWEPSVLLEDGIIEMAEWFSSRRKTEIV